MVYGVVGHRLETDRLLREVDTLVKEIGHNHPLFGKSTPHGVGSG